MGASKGAGAARNGSGKNAGGGRSKTSRPASSRPASPKEQKKYQKIAQQARPRPPVLINCIKAFLTGGVICLVGQGVLNYFIRIGVKPPDSGGPLAGVMVTLGALLTGIGVYDVIGKFGGMGSALPITGFANSIVSPAMEFKREGYVLGVGARMFQVAGPVIVYGLVTSVVVVLIKMAVMALTGKS